MVYKALQKMLNETNLLVPVLQGTQYTASIDRLNFLNFKEKSHIFLFDTVSFSNVQDVH